MAETLKVTGVVLQEKPLVYLAIIPGKWLLQHSTPKWRIQDLQEGFQRVVREDRARKIAVGVLDQRRTFPNAIVLATDEGNLETNGKTIYIPTSARFLVVDGQHRLWAQKFSSFEAEYACVIHMGLSEVAMAKLFLEINDNQRRVPSSLRWDLVRLVRPEDDPAAVLSTEILLELATNPKSPLFQRLDLTGEQPYIPLKQGSLAPEIRKIVATRESPLKDLDFEIACEVFLRYLSAIKSLDPDAWNDMTSPFYKARVLRALLRLLPEIIHEFGEPATKITATDFLASLKKISKSSLGEDEIRAVQGSAGISAIEEIVRKQILG